MSILSILNQIASTSSRNEKESLLRENKDNDLLKGVFRLAYDPSIRFYISDRNQLPDIQGFYGLPEPTLSAALNELLMNIASRKVTGNQAKEDVRHMANQLSDDDREVFFRVLEKDLKVNATGSTANKIWPELIPEHEVMLAHTEIDRIIFPAFSQLKADGARCHMIVNSLGQAVLLTRQGKPIEHHGVFDIFARELLNAAPGLHESTSPVFDGELVCYQVNDLGTEIPLDRKTSNGIINKAIKGTITPEEASTIRFICWDLVDGGTMPYRVRFEVVQKMIESMNPKHVKLIPSKVVNDRKEAMAHYKQMRRLGHEGTMLKNMDAFWVGKRSYDLCKMKAVYEIEMVVVGWELGKKRSKYENKLGGLICQDADRKILVSVGSGYSDEEREEFASDSMIGKIVSVEYNERITSKTGETESLFLPRFTALRLDKSEPNTYNEILAIEKAALGDE